MYSLGAILGMNAIGVKHCSLITCDACSTGQDSKSLYIP